VSPGSGNRRELAIISAAFFFAFLGAGASQPFVVSYLMDGKGLPLGHASLVLSMVYFAFVVFRFFIGFILDRVGLQWGKILGVATYALFPMVLVATGSFPLLLAGSVMWGLGAPMLWTSSLVQVMNASGSTRYATSAGIVRGTVMAAVLLGGIVLSYIYERWGYEALFLSAGASGLVGIGVMAASPRRTVVREKPNLDTFLRVMRSRETQAVVAFLLCSGLAYGLVLNGFKSHIERECGAAWLKGILPCFSVAAILSSFLGGRICDRVGRWPVFAWGFAIGAVGMLLAGVSGHPVALMVAMLLIGVQFAIVPLAGFAWIGDKTTPSDRASVMGYVFCFRDLGVAVAIQLRGLSRDPATAFLVFGGISAVCGVCAFAVGRALGNTGRDCPRGCSGRN